MFLHGYFYSLFVTLNRLRISRGTGFREKRIPRKGIMPVSVTGKIIVMRLFHLKNKAYEKILPVFSVLFQLGPVP